MPEGLAGGFRHIGQSVAWRGTMFLFSPKTGLPAGWLLAGGCCCLAQAPAPASVYIPLTQPKRFHLYLKSLVGPEMFLRSAAGSGITQWSDTPARMAAALNQWRAECHE